MVKIAVFASGSGTNFQRLAEAIENNEIENAIISLLVVDKENAYARIRANNLGIEEVYVNPKEYANKAEFEKHLIKILNEREIDLIVLAGYMRIVGSELLKEYSNKIVNIHPAYLPNFPGAHGISDAFDAKVDFTGVTVHYVDEGIDTGSIIEQEKINIDPEWTLEQLEEKVHELEYIIYPRVINKLCNK